MQRKRQQSLVIPFVVLGVCLFAFGIPYLFYVGVDDTRDDIVLAPRFTATPTPLDRIFTQQAFADLFFTDTAIPAVTKTPFPSSTEVVLVSIPITGATSTYTSTVTPSRTPTRTLIAVFPTRTSSGGGAISSATPTRLPPPTNTAIVIFTPTPTEVTPDPPTETPVPQPTDPPPTDPPTDPPPTDPPTEPPVVP